MAGVPGLSALLAWPTDHLTEAAGYWEMVSERSYGVAHQVWRDGLSVDLARRCRCRDAQRDARGYDEHQRGR